MIWVIGLAFLASFIAAFGSDPPKPPPPQPPPDTAAADAAAAAEEKKAKKRHGQQQNRLSPLETGAEFAKLGGAAPSTTATTPAQNTLLGGSR